MTGVEYRKNPFPYQAADRVSRADVLDEGDSRRVPVTLDTPAIVEARDLATVYLHRFRQQGALNGQVMLLHGEHGSGKTHAIRYLMEQFATPGPETEARYTLRLYAKAQGPGFVELYRRLMADLSLAALRELAQRFLGAVTGETIEAEPDAVASTTKTERARIETDPMLVQDLFDRYLVDRTVVTRRQRGVVIEATSAARDFQRAMSFALDKKLSQVAFNWIRGQQLSEEDVRRLGVEGSIDTPEQALQGLQLLAAVCRRSATALFVFVDQFEKLCLSERTLDQITASALHNLTERLPEEDALFCMAGATWAWQRFAPDLQDRFAHIVLCRPVSLQTARELVAAYLHPDAADDSVPSAPNAPLRPFTTGALGLIHLYSRGNIRQLLQLCATSYDSAVEVDEATVKAVARRGEDLYIDVTTVQVAIREIALEQGFSVTEEQVLEGLSQALMMRGAQSGLAIALVGQAEHYYDEVIDALVELNAIKSLRDDYPSARLILVALGYVSDEVQHKLAQAVHHVLVYEPEEFAAGLRSVLSRIRHLANETPPQPARLASAEVEALRRELEELKRARELEQDALNERTRQVAVRAEQERLAERWDSAATDWAAERSQLETRIRDVRSARRRQDFESLETLREQGEAQSRERAAQRYERQRARLERLMILYALGTVGVAVALALSVDSATGSTTALFLAAVAVAAVFGVPRVLVVRRDEPRTALQGPATSIEDLAGLARAAGTPPLQWLRSDNAHERYAAALLGDLEPSSFREALVTERSRVIRGLLAQRLSQDTDPSSALASLEAALRADIREAVYIAEGLHPSDDSIWPDRKSLTLVWAVRRTDVPLSAATRVLAALADDGVSSFPVDDVDRALRAGPALEHREVLAQLPAALVRRAARELSPLEDGGLGTFDDLRCINRIDDTYLVCLQVLYLAERGLLLAR